MALFGDGDCDYETSTFSGQLHHGGNLLSEYNLFCPHAFQSSHDFEETCMDLYSLVEEEGRCPYFGFIHVTMSDIDNIDEIRSELPRMTILYDWSEETLIVKFLVGVPHEICGGLLSMAFQRLFVAQTGDNYSFIPLKSARFKGSRRMKEGDEAYKPRSWGLVTDWPSIVFEVGVCEGLTQLQQDARFWLESSRSETRIVILVCVNRSNRSIVIQRWQDAQARVAPIRLQQAQNIHAPNPYTRNCVATQIQSLNLHEGQIYARASLFIPAALAYDVFPPGLGPNDFEITSQMLNEFNVTYWEACA